MKTKTGWMILPGMALSALVALSALPAHATPDSVRQARPKEERPRGKEGGCPRGFVARLDRDGDGKVSRGEFDGPPGHFADFDRNRDGFIEGTEAPQGPPPPRGKEGADRFLKRLDRDGDKKVSRDEFDGPEDRFDDLDRNGDGFIAGGEAPNRPPAPRRRSQEKPTSPSICPAARPSAPPPTSP